MINLNKNILKQVEKTIELFYKDKFIDHQREYPSSLFRPDDNVEFSHVAKGFYVLRFSYEQWPEHLHTVYHYNHLISLGFKE